MASLLSILSSQPLRSLAPGELLIAQGGPPGDLFVLESGRLAVEREGVSLATVSYPGAVVGEMSLLLGTPHSATVRAETQSHVRVLANAAAALDTDPALARQLATLLAARLDATSSLLVQLSQQNGGKTEQGLFDRILAAIHLPPIDGNDIPIVRTDLFGTNEPN
jgi:CRP/FNR family transcriptional regulator, cyclic AMP receptor protein